MNAVIYARYSSEGQREESIDGQIRECMEYCKQNGMTVVKEYIDRALSAKTDNRPDFQRMIKDSAKGLFDVVVVWKLDRFARNRYDSAHYKAALKKNGVREISAKENIADGPEGIILESMLEGMAEYYSAELSVKVIRGHTENALKCKYNGGTPTFGFAIDANKQYQPDPVTAPIVLDIFKMYDTGSTMKQIMDHLNALGVTIVRGKPADLNFISGILHNRKYIGEYKYRDIVVPDGIPALVPTDLFERVQEQMKKNKKAPARHKAEDDYLLTTKLFCGSCKAMMVGESGTSSSKGQVYHYYRCVKASGKRPVKPNIAVFEKTRWSVLLLHPLCGTSWTMLLWSILPTRHWRYRGRKATNYPPCVGNWQIPTRLSTICSTQSRQVFSTPLPSAVWTSWKPPKKSWS